MSLRGSDNKGKAKKSATVISKKVDTAAKKKAKNTHLSYGRYINQLLKNSHPEMGVTKNGMKVLNSFVCDIADRIANEAGVLTRYHKTMTLSSFHVMGAVKLVLPPEIAQNAIEEGQRAYKAITATKKTSA